MLEALPETLTAARSWHLARGRQADSAGEKRRVLTLALLLRLSRPAGSMTLSSPGFLVLGSLDLVALLRSTQDLPSGTSVSAHSLVLTLLSEDLSGCWPLDNVPSSPGSLRAGAHVLRARVPGAARASRCRPGKRQRGQTRLREGPAPSRAAANDESSPVTAETAGGPAGSAAIKNSFIDVSK
ncbi:hypothetical protein CB1_000309013 [Camelus ferus]|nr:hypothetical protein CB1_000309013 [Camelus ferus]